MNIILTQNNALKRKSDNRITDFTHRIIFSNSAEFKGYEYYQKLNKELQKKGEPYQYKTIPCGKCIGCRANERKNWAIRIEKEAKQYKNNYFITLTYNDQNLIIPEYSINKRTGEKYENKDNWREWTGTLNKKDMSQFIKSLRTYFEREYNWQGMKFYGCGEYGEKSERPHYHIILLNCPEIQLDPIGKNKKTKDCYYTNERIEHIWGKGFITIGKVTWESISYTVGYVSKKLFGNIKEEYYALKGQEPIFANMSRRPGIGRQYFEDNKNKIYDFDEILNSKGQPVQIPRYFDKLMDIGNEEDYEYIKAIKRIRNEKAKNEQTKKMSQTTLTIKEQMAIEEKTALEKQKKYNRGRIK